MIPLDYHTPPSVMPPADPEREHTSRAMAAVLLGGAAVWAVVVLVFVVADPPSALPLFAPGFLVIFAYCWRVFGRPTAGWCRAIWGTSLVVHGAWLYWALVGSAEWAAWRGCFTCVMILWWASAVIVSLVGLLSDRGVG